MEEWIIKLYSKNNCGLGPYGIFDHHRHQSFWQTLDRNTRRLTRFVLLGCTTMSSTLITRTAQPIFLCPPMNGIRCTVILYCGRNLGTLTIWKFRESRSQPSHISAPAAWWHRKVIPLLCSDLYHYSLRLLSGLSYSSHEGYWYMWLAVDFFLRHWQAPW